MKPRFTLTPLSKEDGTWISFVTDWRDQARRVEPAVPLNEYAFGVLRSLAAGKLSIIGGSVSKAAVSAFRNNHDGRFYGVCLLSAAHLPGFDGADPAGAPIARVPLAGLQYSRTLFLC
jgi:hypothetical protein